MIPNPKSELVEQAKYFLLEEDDIIEETDEYYNNFQDKWLPIQEEFFKNQFRADESKPVRRLNPRYIERVKPMPEKLVGQ